MLGVVCTNQHRQSSKQQHEINMAESWSTSRQALVYAESAFTFSTDRDAEAGGAIRTYVQAQCETAGYIFSGTARWCICVPVDPDHTDRVCMVESLMHGDNTLQAICFQDTSAIFCQLKAVDDNGPVVLEYPKYFNDPTLPPDFDVVFRVFSDAKLDWTSFSLNISTSSGASTTYGLSNIVRTGITSNITEIRLTPNGLATTVGDTITVSLFLKDIYNRPIRTNW